MILIPAIDILNGKCVRLLRGDYNQVTEYGEDPVEMARVWADGGARWLHLVDLDGARTGRPVNDGIITRIARTLEIPVQVGGGVRTADHVRNYLEAGVDRVILGTTAFRKPDLLEQVTSENPGRIWVGIDSRDGRVAIEGWRKETSADAFDLAAECERRGSGGIVFTDISRDGTLIGPNLASLRTLSERVSIPLIASGGIASLEDLKSLRDLRVSTLEGVITGKALYSGAFTIQEAIAVAEG